MNEAFESAMGKQAITRNHASSAVRDNLEERTDAANAIDKDENTTAVIWKMLLLAEQRLYRLEASEDVSVPPVVNL